MLGMFRPEHPARLKPQAAMATVRFMVASVHCCGPRPRPENLRDENGTTGNTFLDVPPAAAFKDPSRVGARASQIQFCANVP
jgi:hypothetical protein